MPDEVGTKATRSDVPSADDSLFGDAADDTEAAVADEQDAGDETGSSEDLKVVVSRQGRQGHHRGATALVGPAHRDLR